MRKQVTRSLDLLTDLQVVSFLQAKTLKACRCVARKVLNLRDVRPDSNGTTVGRGRFGVASQPARRPVVRYQTRFHLITCNELGHQVQCQAGEPKPGILAQVRAERATQGELETSR